MRDTDLYKAILGLHEPWFITNVDLDPKAETVTVHVDVPPGTMFQCPQCKSSDCPVYDSRPRKWRHLDTCQFKTFIEAPLPRINCSGCGVKTINPPWAEGHSRFTLMFERFVIDALKEMSMQGASRLLRLSWDQLDSIVQRAVRRGLHRRDLGQLKRIAIDEKCIGSGQNSYITIVSDLETSKVVWVGKDRRRDTLDQFFYMIGPNACSQIECICMDMWRPFQSSCRKWIADADAKTVLDRFHIEKHLGEAVDLVRKQEQRELMRQGDDRLKGSKWDWLTRREHLDEVRLARFDDLRKSDLRTARAWALRENFRHIWSFEKRAFAAAHFDRWHEWATRSGLLPMQRVAKRLKTHLNRILTYLQFRVTNAKAEGINNKIQTIKKKAYGFRNVDRLINMIYFHCSGLNLYPDPL